MAAKLNIDKAILYLSGKISENDKIAFEAWLGESDINYSRFDEFKKYWEHSGKAYSYYSPDLAKGWKIVKSGTIEKEVGHHRVIPLTYRILKIAATVLILISLGVSGKFLYNWWQQEDFESFYSGNNIVTVSLSDGSTVWLNAQSELSVPKIFKGHKRNVYLKGEAFFDVAKNSKKPFKIYAHKSVTEVLGTTFNLKAKEQDSIIQIAVVTGKVAFYEQGNIGNKIILLPGQNGCFNVEGRLFYMKPINNNFMAWKTRKFDFRNASLQEVCDALSDYYNVKIQPGAFSKDSRYSFTGTFNNAPIGEAISVIELTLGIKFVKSDGIIKAQL